MDAPVDFSLDRARLLNGNLVSSALGSYNGGSYGEAGHTPALNRNTATGLASTTSLQEMARVGTPATLTSVEQYQPRFLHPALSFPSQDASYAVMSNYLSASGAGADHLKSLVPDMQQYWSAHGDGLPRYLVNNNSIYPPYLSYLPATESLSLFAQNASAPGAPYHRIYDLHKDALYHTPTGGIFNTVSPGVSTHAIRQSADQLPSVSSCTKKELNVRTSDSKRTLDLSKQSPKICESNTKTKNSRDPDKKEEIRKLERQSDSSKHSPKHADTKRDSKRMCEFSPTRSKKAKITNAKDTDSENKKQARILTKEEANYSASTCRTSEGKTESEKEAKSAESSIKVPKADGVPPSQKSTSPSSSDENGAISKTSTHGSTPEMINTKQSTISANTATTFSLPYYHSIYSHSQPSSATDGKRVHAPTFTPEIVTLPSVVSIAALPVQTVACDMRIKKEKASSPHACCKQTNVVTTNVGLCQPNSKIHDNDSPSSSLSNANEPLELTHKECTKTDVEKNKNNEDTDTVKSDSKENETQEKCKNISQNPAISEGTSLSTATSINSSAHDTKISKNVSSDASSHKSKNSVQPIISDESTSSTCINDFTKSSSSNGSLNEENSHSKMSKVNSPVAKEPPSTSGSIKPSDFRTVRSVGNTKDTNLIVSGLYDKRDDKSPCKAINLTKEKAIPSPPVSEDKLKEKKNDQHDVKENERILYKKPEFTSSTKKRSERSGKRDSKKDTMNVQDSSNTSGMSNIPIGIAVAQKRELKKETTDSNTETPETAPILPESLSGQHGESQSSGNGQTSSKATTPSSTVTDMRNQLPANLIVTGSANGTGVAWADDPSTRHFVSPWIQSGHALNTTHWLGQMPFAISPSIPTSGTLDTSQLPVSIPPGYKLVQDSVTGQLVLIPSNIDMYDPNRLWSFPAGHPGTFPQIYAAHQPSQLQHSVLPQHPERQATDFAIAVQQYQQLQMLQNRTNNLTDTKPVVSLPCKIPPDHPVVQSDNSQVKEIQTVCKIDPPSTKIAVVKDKIRDPQIPNQDSVAILNRTVAPFNAVIPADLSCSVPLATTVKVEPSTVQSRGTSPMVPASECEETPQDKIDETSTANTVNQTKGTTTENNNGNICNVASVQTETVEKSFYSIPVTSSDLTKTKDVEKDQNAENSSAEKVKDESSDKTTKSSCDINSDERKSLPTTTVIDNVTIVEMTPKTKSASSTNPDNNNSIPKDNCTEIKDESREASKPRSVESYNPFLDPQILQAADGLELLSALAEQRAKCVSVDSDKQMSDHDAQPLSQFSNKKTEPKQDKNKLFSNEKETKPAVKQKRKNSTSRTRSIPPVKANTKNDSSSYYTSTGLRIPQGEEEINAIELDMRIRLAELQRQYKEKQKQLAKLQPRKDKEKEDFSKQRGPGRPKKRKHHSGSPESTSKTPPTKGKDPPTKKKKQAEELVDRVFRKTGGGFGMPLSKKLKANAMAALFKTQSGFTMKRKGSTSGGRTSKTGKQLLFGESKLFQQAQGHSSEIKVKAKRSKSDERSEKVVKKISSSKERRNDTSIENVEISSKQIKFGNDTKSPKLKNENGLGLLATYAAKELNDSPAHKKAKKKREDDECKTTTNDSECRSTVFTDSLQTSTNNQNITDSTKQRDSDPDVSCDSSTHEYKKRKPGRPRKCTPDQTNSGTETIVAKNSKNFQIFQMQSFREQWNTNAQQQAERKPKLPLDNQQPMKPIFLDEEWLRRRSERIFLSDPSPQPSPNINSASQPVSQKSQSNTTAAVKQKSEKAKLQKARNIQELSQRVKKKYSKKFQKSKSMENREKFRLQKKPSVIDNDRDSDSSESDGDNIPLSILRERPSVSEPRSCVIDKDELKDGLRVLVFKDGLFYEGAVKGIRPPDVYGVVVDNARGNRPYIYSQEEILKEAIIDVKPSSSRFLKEGTRVCAYWSQQFSCLYPGTVAKASPNPHADKSSINVEFDDGDSGRIPLDHIRMLAQDFPLVSYDPNPLLLIGKRRRHTTSESVESKKSERSESVYSKPKVKRGPGRPPKAKQDSVKEKEDDEDIDVCGLDDDNDDVFTSSCVADEMRKHDQRKSQKHSSGKLKKKHKHKEKDGDTKSEMKNREKGDNSRNNSNSSSEQGKHSKYSFHLSRYHKISKLFKTSSFKYRSSTYPDTQHQSKSSDDDSVIDDTYSDCRLHDQIPPLDGDDDVYSFDEVNGYDTNSLGCASKKKKNSSVSYESKLAAFQPARQLWHWSGKSTKRPGMKGKAKKEFYKSIVRGKEQISVGDCAVFLSTGRPHLPYVGRIDSMWEAWGGQMVVKVKWFYHPEETRGGKKLQDMKGALFQSLHIDENDVQTISHKCDVMSYTEYSKRKACGMPTDGTNVYYLAGTYEPTIGLLKFEEDLM